MHKDILTAVFVIVEYHKQPRYPQRETGYRNSDASVQLQCDATI